ncbi:CACTA en-spm transposon protein [Cucumis melo var. makuwa]|uniref:CACTA en-spm transposon protein n=1 Tax=Cucumis melo var. makuwa TaxID=1194695 RepID=A0A5D3BYY5_CUCMM|nr:CACTA en-spm transposon protein [Cucumis melo var. makuwa]
MDSTTIPSSFSEIKRKLRDLGLGYETIHACKDKCVETDDVLRHSADANGGKHFDCEFPNFSSDPWNGGVRRGIRHIPYVWMIDHLSRYEVEYPSWDVDAIFQKTTCGVEVGYMMESGIETRFTREEQNDGTISNDEVIGEFEIFKQKVRQLGTISSFSSGFNEKDAMFREFIKDLNNTIGGSSSVGDNLEHYVHANRRIPMSIDSGVEKRISPHVVRLSLAINMCVRKTFPFYYLRWADLEKEYIKVVKGDLQSFFVLDFNDQTMNRFVEHQMLTTFKKFMGHCHRHFRKYSDPEEASANPPHILVGHMKDWIFLYDHYMSYAFQEQSRTNKVARQKQYKNYSSRSKSFLQRQHELDEQRDDQATQKALIGDPNPSPAKRPVLVVP